MTATTTENASSYGRRIAIWNYLADLDCSRFQFDSDLEYIKKSRIPGFWFWLPNRLIHTFEYSTVFESAIGAAIQRWCTELSKRVSRKWREDLKLEPSTRSRGIGFTGVLIGTGHRELFGQDFEAYYDWEWRAIVALMNSMPYIDRAFCSRLLKRLQPQQAIQTTASSIRRTKERLKQVLCEPRFTKFNTGHYAFSPHAFVISPFLSQSFINSAKAIKNEWYATINAVRRTPSSEALLKQPLGVFFNYQRKSWKAVDAGGYPLDEVQPLFQNSQDTPGRFTIQGRFGCHPALNRFQEMATRWFNPLSIRRGQMPERIQSAWCSWKKDGFDSDFNPSKCLFDEKSSTPSQLYQDIDRRFRITTRRTTTSKCVDMAVRVLQDARSPDCPGQLQAPDDYIEHYKFISGKDPRHESMPQYGRRLIGLKKLKNRKIALPTSLASTLLRKLMTLKEWRPTSKSNLP